MSHVWLVDAERPWPGLLPFTEDYRAFFFGREIETDELCRLVEREALTVLFGQSGLGKSSLLHAGVFPRLRRAGYLPLYVRLNLDSSAPPFMEQVWQVLRSECARHEVAATSARRGDDLWRYLHRPDTKFLNPHGREVRAVLVLDQFEEIFTLGRQALERTTRCHAFLKELDDLVENRAPLALEKEFAAEPERVDDYDLLRHDLKIVFSFREDYLAEFEGLKALIRPIMQNRFRLTPMVGDRAAWAIQQAGSGRVSEEVAQRIVRFVGGGSRNSTRALEDIPVEPALLSLVCRELNEQRIARKEHAISAALIQGDNAHQIIEQFYSQGFADLDLRLRYFVEDRLLTKSGDRDSCALDNALSEPGVDESSLQALVDRRILRREERSGQVRLELIHDVLAAVAKVSRDGRREAEELSETRRQLARQRRRQRWTLGISAAVIAVLVITLPLAGWRRLEETVLDSLLTSLHAPKASSLPITLVAIDETSLAQMGKWPWPRSVHAELVDQLNRAGALVVAFDTLFSEPSNEKEDGAFAEAIARGGNVVLASDFVYEESGTLRQWRRVDPYDRFLLAGASAGLAAVSFDTDQIVRRMPEGKDTFWRQIATRVEAKRPGLISAPSSQEGMLIAYSGPEATFPSVSYYQALKADTYLPPDAFRDQIVIVGRQLRASPELGMGRSDLFATPFTSKTGSLMSGIELHANILESAIANRSVASLGVGWTLVLLLATIALSTALMWRWRAIVSSAIALVLMITIAIIDWWLFTRQALWWPALSAIASVSFVYAALGIRARILRQRGRVAAIQAASPHLPPNVVAELKANPASLSTEAERRDVTVLRSNFTGFSLLAERLGPKEIADLLDSYHSRMASIIKRHGGTVSRLLGDSTVAVWGAPLLDERQAINACRAAAEMQDHAMKLRVSLERRGLPLLDLRAAVHSGPAVVLRPDATGHSDFTVVGSVMSLVESLERLNSVYSTEVLVTAITALRAGAAVPMRRVDRIAIKGASEPVDLFTPCEDHRINAISAEAIEAFYARQWERSEGLWLRVAQLIPRDRIAEIYLQRIRVLRDTPPADSWNGVVAFE